MKKANYYFNNICHRGNTLYYSLRHLPKAPRQAIIEIHAFYHEIRSILFKYNEPMMARTRFQWWRNEVSKVFSGQMPEHPIMQSLQQSLDLFPYDKSLLFEMINGFESYLDHPEFSSSKTLYDFLIKTAGNRERLILGITKQNEDNEYTNQLGAGLEMIYFLRNFRKLIQHSLYFFTDQQLKLSNCKLADLSQRKHTESTQQFFQQYAKQARDYLSNARASELHLKHNNIRINIYLRLLDDIEKDDFNVFERYISLNPLRKLWIAH